MHRLSSFCIFVGIFFYSGSLLLLRAQGDQLGVPAITATPKGPNQINLTWPAVSNPGYGYLVEIQSAEDSRYPAWTELQPIPTASGYTCDKTIVFNGATCNISDPSGIHVYNPPHNGIPYWVTDKTYFDPQDESPAQFITAGLKPNTAYSFRVRTYSHRVYFENSSEPVLNPDDIPPISADSADQYVYGAYSVPADTRTDNY